MHRDLPCALSPVFGKSRIHILGSASSVMRLTGGMYKGRQMLSSDAVKAMTTNHLTVAQRKDGEIILQESQGWGYGLSVPVEKTPPGAPAGTIG